MMHKHAIATALVVTTLAACTPNTSTDSYSIGSVGQVNRSIKATVINVREVSIEGRSDIGGAAGAGIGAAGGAALGGSGEGAIIGAIAGAVIGGVAGAHANKKMTEQMGYEVTVETQNGLIFTIVQGKDLEFEVGESVLIAYGQRSRVIKYPNNGK